MSRAAEDYARRYCAAGLAVLPCPLGKKEPDPELAPHGVYSASTDRATLHDWFGFVARNIAIAVPAGVVVVDVDPRNGGIETMRALVEEHGKLPATPRQRSGSGGVHLLFQRPAGELRGKVGPGVDLLGVGRYFVCAPSLHPNGKPYTWIVAPWEVPVSPMPEWLAELCHRPAPPAPPSAPRPTPTIDRVRAYVARCEPAISGQGGHAATFRVACVIAANVSDEGEQFALLAEYNQRCEPPWSERQLLHKLADARRRPDLRPLEDRPRRDGRAA